MNKTVRSTLSRLAALSLLLGADWSMHGAAVAASVDASTLTGKMIMGYQGWFACPGDGSGQGWVHWKDGSRVTVEMLPDVSELAPSEQCPAGLTAGDGSPVAFYSAQNPATVARHFAWMRRNGIDGVALQRFATQLLDPKLTAAADRVLANVRAGAEHEGRVFALEYDLSSMPVAALPLVVQDWRRVIASGLVKSKAYLHHKGHPLLGLWGLGFRGRPLSAAAAMTLVDQLREASKPVGGVIIFGGVPSGWRTGTGDASSDSAWAQLWPKLDVISPWTIGHYGDDASADAYRTRTLLPDMAMARSLGIDYMPVLFPGFSWSNLMHARHSDLRAIFDQVPRRCGRFYWHQAANAINSGASMLFTAMFDELDEATAMFEAVADANKTPPISAFVTLNEGNCVLPNDWYLRLGGAVQAALNKRVAPPEMPFAIPAE